MKYGNPYDESENELCRAYGHAFGSDYPLKGFLFAACVRCGLVVRRGTSPHPYLDAPDEDLLEEAGADLVALRRELQEEVIS